MMCWENLTVIRKSRGVSLREIADSTKISTRYLRAIEAGDFKKLPGGVYNTSYLRQYARAISFDEDDLVQSYLQQTGTDSATQPAPVAKTGNRLDEVVSWLFSPAAGSQERAH
jgi:cytoskeletal protein RodZ